MQRSIGSLCSLLLLCVGCGNKETYPQAPYRYQLNARGLDINGLEVRVNGKPLVRRESSFEVSAKQLLAAADTSIEVTITTSCGDTTVALRSALDVAAEKATRSTATSFIWELVPVDVETATLYLDNAFGGRAATAKVGAYSFSLKPSEARVEKVRIGTCGSARRIEVDGAPVGELPALEAREAALVSTSADQCYLFATGYYSALNYEAGELPNNAQVFRPKERVTAVPAADYFPAAAMPEQKQLAPTAGTEAATFIEPIACELASAITKRRARRAR